jgi:hypothetical protein
MSNHDKLGQELGISQGDVAGIELNEEDLEQVAGGHHGSTTITSTTIIHDEDNDH